MKKKAIALLSSALPDRAVSRLDEEFLTFPLPPDEDVDLPVRTHPDMIFSVLRGRIFYPAQYAEKHPGIIEKIASLSSLDAVKSTAARNRFYPNDVSLNTSVIGNFLLCRKKSASEELLSFAEDCGMTVLDTKQGYAGCSCLVAENAVLTSDAGIHAILSKNGVDCSLTDEKIALDGYDCGFIGGCGGYFGGTVYLFGESELGGWAKARGLEVVNLMSGALRDFGGIKFIPIDKTNN